MARDPYLTALNRASLRYHHAPLASPDALAGCDPVQLHRGLLALVQFHSTNSTGGWPEANFMNLADTPHNGMHGLRVEHARLLDMRLHASMRVAP